MKQVRFKNIPAIVNLTWHALPPDQSERSAVKATLEQNKGAKAGVVVKYGGVTLLGLGPPNTKVINGPSAAAWLAIANQKALDQGGNSGMPSTGSGSTNDWIVVENLGDGSYWLAIIRDGVPLPGTDIILDREVTLDLIREAVETAPFIVFSPDEGIREDVPAGTIVEDKGFADLVQGTKPGKAAMRAISGVSVKVLAAIGGLILLGVLWMGYSWWANKRAQEEMIRNSALQNAEQQKQMAADKADYAAKVKQAVLDALDKGEKDLNLTLAAPSANDAIGTWVGLVADVSPNQNGWNITGFECDLADAGTPACKVNLARGQYGINRILLSDHPDAILEGDAASFVVSGETLQKRDIRFQDIERANTFNLEFISDLQMLHFANLSYSISQSTDVVSAITMPPIPASIFKPGDAAQAAPSPSPVKMGVASGELTFSGSELWQLEGLREFLRRENVSVQNVSISMSDITPAAWTLRGKYYIKNAPEPVLPVVLSPDQEPIQVSLPERYRATPQELASWTGSDPVAPAESTVPQPEATEPSSGSAPLDPSSPAESLAEPIAPLPEAPPPPAPPIG